jgi:HEAT repeat protein
LAISYVASPEFSASLPASEAKPLVRERLLATGVFGREGSGAYRGEAAVLCVLRAVGGGRAPLVRTAITISLDSDSSPRLQAKILAEKPVPDAREPGPKRRRALRAFLERALGDAARLVAIEARLEHSPTAMLVPLTRDPDRDVRDHAVQILGVRRAREAVPAVLESLSDPDLEVAQHAVGALISIGDPRATSKIIELTKRKTGLFLKQLLYALASFGDREAEAFLWSMSQGHPDPNIQRTAQAALESLRRKRARRER